MSAYDLAWVDPEAAIARATEGLTLARRSGTGGAIAANLRALAVALASSDPQRAAALLAEADTVAPGSGVDSHLGRLHRHPSGRLAERAACR